MENENHIAIRRKPFRPRKRVLVPRANRKVNQSLVGGAAELNSNFFDAPSGSRRGPPVGNKNALRHSRYTREMRAFRAEVRAQVRDNWNLVAALKRMLREATGDIRAGASDPPDS